MNNCLVYEGPRSMTDTCFFIYLFEVDCKVEWQRRVKNFVRCVSEAKNR